MDHQVVGGNPECFHLDISIIPCKDFKYPWSYITQEGKGYTGQSYTRTCYHSKIQLYLMVKEHYTKNKHLSSYCRTYISVSCRMLTLEINYFLRSCRIFRLSHIGNDTIAQRAKLKVQLKIGNWFGTTISDVWMKKNGRRNCKFKDINIKMEMTYLSLFRPLITKRG